MQQIPNLIDVCSQSVHSFEGDDEPIRDTGAFVDSKHERLQKLYEIADANF
eukprot:TRINITY_DN2717_c0_g1_i2.p4 TRINITY_DN2717_c0_g1~~TRINITY_DN2717_c0_g1_i2.p4  ORF type:complete len:51 (-),score=13.54 TRINITY_DN2717_c0_g1_i2:357-509(-)